MRWKFQEIFGNFRFRFLTPPALREEAAAGGKKRASFRRGAAQEPYYEGHRFLFGESPKNVDRKPAQQCRGRVDVGKVSTNSHPAEIYLLEKKYVQGAARDERHDFLREGRVLHDKSLQEKLCLESGSEFKVCDFHGIKLGIMICYDREYPESARVLMLKGAEIIFVPNDCASMSPRLNALSTRAYENMTGIAMANPPGDNAGNSCAFSPICWDENGICTDNILLMAGEKETGLFYADFDMESIRKYRETEMMGNTFRKVKAYTELMNPEILPPFIRKI